MTPQPPRTWGRRCRHHAAGGQHPSTPTHVGQTPPPSAWNGRRHLNPHARGADEGELAGVKGAALNPHARGADGISNWIDAGAGPQPPRTWGRRGWARALFHGGPSTPTHVGQTGPAPRTWPRQHLNPHARGADLSACFAMATAAPQPPRTWGRLKRVIIVGERQPSTPTHVGQTSMPEIFSRILSLNPHARGADRYLGLSPGSVFPQPPRTWGRHVGVTSGNGSQPSTPTHVGQTGYGQFIPRLLGLNPHARGADLYVFKHNSELGPQPPRTWGRLYALTL